MGVRFRLVVCDGPTCGGKRDSAGLTCALQEAVKSRGLADQVSLERETCFGQCLRGANVLVVPVAEGDTLDRPVGPESPGAILYSRMEARDVPALVDRHLVAGQVAWSLAGRPAVWDD